MEQLVAYFTSLGMPMAQAVQMAQQMAGQPQMAAQQAPMGAQATPSYAGTGPLALQPPQPSKQDAARQQFSLNTDGHASTAAAPTPGPTPVPKKRNLNDQGIDYDDAHSAMVSHLSTKYKMKPEEAGSFAREMLVGKDPSSQQMRNDALQHLIAKGK